MSSLPRLRVVLGSLIGAFRKLLMEVELPSETQQIDRVLQAFADRYHECNPFVYKDGGNLISRGPSLEISWLNSSSRRPSILHCVFVDYASHRFLQQE